MLTKECEIRICVVMCSGTSIHISFHLDSQFCSPDHMHMSKQDVLVNIVNIPANYDDCCSIMAACLKH
jgi:hypothetical protein